MKLLKILFILFFATIIYAKTISIEAVGYGNSENEALKSALNNAVSQAVGVMITSESVSENGKLIKDKILSFSKGYVTKYKKLSSKAQMGFWEVKILAQVNETKLVNNLKKLNLKPYNMKTKNLYAKLVTQVKSKYDAEDLIFNLFYKYGVNFDFYKKTFYLAVDNVNIDVDGATRTIVPMTIKIKIANNWPLINQVNQEISDTFKAIGGKKVSKDKWNEKIGIIQKLTPKKEVYWNFPHSYKSIYPFVFGDWFNIPSDSYYFSSPLSKEDLKYYKKKLSKDKIYKYEGYYIKPYIQFLDKNGKVLKEIFFEKYLHNDTGFLNRGYYYLNKIFYISNDSWCQTDGNFLIKIYHLPIHDSHDSISTIKVPINILKDVKQIKVKEVWVE